MYLLIEVRVLISRSTCTYLQKYTYLFIYIRTATYERVLLSYLRPLRLTPPRLLLLPPLRLIPLPRLLLKPPLRLIPLPRLLPKLAEEAAWLLPKLETEPLRLLLKLSEEAPRLLRLREEELAPLILELLPSKELPRPTLPWEPVPRWELSLS